MTVEAWHSEFNPSKFLSRVNLAQLIERNEAYNENHISDAKAPCILCGKTYSIGILLNDKSFLCQQCYSEVALISYPEKYEALRRQFVIAVESRRLAWEGFQKKFEYKSEESALVFLGWLSLPLAFANPAFLILTAILLTIGYTKNSVNKQKTDEWLSRKARWEQNNPEPTAPTLKHFHDPTAQLTQRDRQILKIFNHWPGYPPFWKYLRSVVISRDSNRCQVTGCPSRLGLHVHHMRPVAEGGTHAPDNLVSLCDFHHALEPEKGHERIWANIKNNTPSILAYRGLFSDMAMLVREVQVLKAHLPMLVTLSGIVTKTRDSHQLKAEKPMEVTPTGMVTTMREEQPLKASSPMVVTLLGMVMEGREEQEEKADSPMLVTPTGMATEVREAHPEKAMHR